MNNKRKTKKKKENIIVYKKKCVNHENNSNDSCVVHPYPLPSWQLNDINFIPYKYRMKISFDENVKRGGEKKKHKWN